MKWEPLVGTKREWGEDMVELAISITNDETLSIICHESIKDKIETVGLVRVIMDAGALESDPAGLKRMNKEAEKNGEEL